MAHPDSNSRRERLVEECTLGVEDACVELANEAPPTRGVQERQQRESAAAAYYNAQSVALPADGVACDAEESLGSLTLALDSLDDEQRAAAAQAEAFSLASASLDLATARAEEEERRAEDEAIGAWSAGLAFEPLRLSREEAARQAFAGGGARAAPGAFLSIEELAAAAADSPSYSADATAQAELASIGAAAATAEQRRLQAARPMNGSLGFR